MENTSPDQPRIPTSIIVIAGILFLLSGLLSTYLYYIFNRHVGVIIPPILYTSVTLIVFRMCNIPVRTKKWVIYFLLMLILYIFTWVVALFSSIIILISGIIVAGIGAMESFVLVYKFITKFRLSRLQAFLAGAVAFGIADILVAVMGKYPMEYLGGAEEYPEVLFADIFIYWQFIVGMTLVITLRKRQTVTSDNFKPQPGNSNL